MISKYGNILILICLLVVINSCNSINTINTISSLDDHPEYRHLINKKYTTNNHLVIFKQKSGDDEYQVGIPGKFLPKIEKLENYPMDYEDVYIYGIIPQGTEIEILNIIVENRLMHGSNIYIKAKINSGNEFKNDIVDVTYLSDYSKDKKEMDSKYVTEIIPE